MNENKEYFLIRNKNEEWKIVEKPDWLICVPTNGSCYGPYYSLEDAERALILYETLLS